MGGDSETVWTFRRNNLFLLSGFQPRKFQTVAKLLFWLICPGFNNYTNINTKVHGGRRSDVVGVTTDLAFGRFAVQFSVGTTRFSFLDSFQAGFGSHTTSFPTSTEGFYRRVKRPGHESDHSLPPSDQVKKKWSSTATLFMSLHYVNIENSTLAILYLFFGYQPDEATPLSFHLPNTSSAHYVEIFFPHLFLL